MDRNGTLKTGSARRDFLAGGLALVGSALACGACPAARAAESNAPAPPAANPKASMGPQAGDHFVYLEGPRAGRLVRPADLREGAGPVFAWPFDPAARLTRNGNPFNEILLLRLRARDRHDAETRATSGIVAFSAICTHASCPVTDWMAKQHLLHCLCHGSEYDPSRNAKVVFGPAPRPLPRLAIKLAGGAIQATAGFTERLGGYTSRTD